MLHPLIGAIDLDISGPEQAYEWLLPSLPRWSPRAHQHPRIEIALDVDFGSPPPDGEPVLDLPLASVSRDAEGRLLVTAPRVGARIGTHEIELRYEPSASPRCVQAVFDAIWPLVLPAFGFYHVHAAALSDEEDRGWLLVGQSGVGKSTSTLALAGMGWHYAADEAVYLSVGAEGLVAHGWIAPIRVTARTAYALGVEREAPFSEIKSSAVLDVALAGRRVDHLPVHRLVFPDFGAATALLPIGHHDALERLLTISPWLSCLPTHARRYLDHLERLSQLPSSVLLLGPELLEEPTRLAAHLTVAVAAEVAA